MINQFLMQLSPETANTLYSSLGFLQFPAYAAILALTSVKYRFSLKRAAILWVSFAIAVFWSSSMPPVFSRLTNGIIPGINMGVAFAFFLPILAALACFLNIPASLAMDASVPAFILGRGMAITGCVFTGCCHGFPVAWGIYSRAAETLTFPTVFLDIVLSCCIVVYLISLAHKQKWSGNGSVAATGILLFGILRILIDILRDNQKLFFVLTAEGIFGIAYAAAGYFLLRHIYHSR